ncbi:uncharacterized protein STEHIDRAFT_115142 [Stereum hirsutum FP-91666 SS1]|uniref:uncharacterized protein n=1 Tax=Stereum hirsutum (strain FP-91666) TaxID=721885 RepID=UPI000444A339|nr:uncharacterized protein STEHIDRAFT_115142 [Stereum hirsutum FP-91666 SS1]EIM80932.1 hypothetical protein STEHIDRAFT_115142 [Stereum hirsutum FP-91666 SS1]
MSTEPAENPIVVNLSPTYGALLIGTAFACAIWGVTSTQAKSAQKDSRVMRYFVSVTFYGARFFDIHGRLLRDSRPKPTNVGREGLWILSTRGFVLLLYGAIAPLSRITVVLLHRIWITLPLLVHGFVVGYPFATFYDRRRDLFARSNDCGGHINQFVYVLPPHTGNSTSIFALISIGSTRQMVNRLTKVAVMSGVFTTVFSIFVVSFMAARPSDLFYTIFETPLTSLYVSVLLSNLNARHYVRGTSDINWTSQVEFSSSGGQTVRLNTLNPPTSRALTWGNRNLKATKEHAIQIHTKSETQTDGPSGSSVDVDAGSCSVKNMPESV